MNLRIIVHPHGAELIHGKFAPPLADRFGPVKHRPRRSQLNRRGNNAKQR